MKLTAYRASSRMVLLTATVLSSVIATASFAQETVRTSDAAEAQSTADVTDESIKTIIVHAERSRAAATAPSMSSLSQAEPQAIVSRAFIETSIAETADFTGIANVTPSMASPGSNNGPGFGEAKVTLRGFQDGDYNVTMDGIPWGDTNNPTHHSNSFFPASTIGALIVDRGPGAVADLGQANYGGNIKMFSNKVADNYGVTLRETVGTWNSWQSVGVVQTGKIESLGNLAGFVNVQMNGSDGALTYSSMHSANITTKWVLPISKSWNLTFFGMHNANKWHKSDNPAGTLSQVALYGKDFGLSNDPTKATYFGYNLFNKHTTFGYIKAAGDLPFGFTLDNTAYNIYYDNHTQTAKNLTSINGVDTPYGLGTYVTNAYTVGGVEKKPAASNPKGIQAYEKLNHYMTWGNMARLTREFSVGTAHAGLWTEIASTNRHTYDYDAQLGFGEWDHREKRICTAYSGVTCTTFSTDDSLNYRSYEERSSWTQTQSYLDFAWNITDKLTVTPGVKHVSMKRIVEAPVIKAPRQSEYASNKNSKWLSNLTANYALAKDWSVYAQYAEGMYLPDLSALYVINPAGNGHEPQLSTNYQAGTVYQSHHWAVDADLYRVELTNILSPTADVSTFTNIASARNTGVEGQVSYAFENGITLYANGSSNKYVNNATGKQISGAPVGTAGLGALYHSGPWSGSLLLKHVGKTYNDNTETSENKAYGTADLTANYEFGHYVIKAQVNNILDNRASTSIKVNANPALSTYTYLVGQNVQLSLIVKY